MNKVMLGLAALCAVAGMTGNAGAQTLPATPTTKPGTPADPALVPRTGATAAQGAGAGGGGAATTTAAPAFPPVDPKNFTAASPSVETVNSFLHALWGFDVNRAWSVAAIQPTIAPGVVRVQVLVAEKNQAGRIGQTTMYITPDGKHTIAGEVIDFGAKPFAENRATVLARADGPVRGTAAKDLEIAAFVDLGNPASKAAQTIMDQIAQDIPQAHLVYMALPLSGHPASFLAAAVGGCVRQAKGDPGFFTYIQKVFDTQADLTAEKSDATLRAAVTAAGGDPAAALTCANSAAAQGAVNASVKLATDLGIYQAPVLVVNGRILPVAQVPYEALKRVIVFQGSLDGLAVQAQPSLKTLK